MGRKPRAKKAKTEEVVSIEEALDIDFDSFMEELDKMEDSTLDDVVNELAAVEDVDLDTEGVELEDIEPIKVEEGTKADTKLETKDDEVVLTLPKEVDVDSLAAKLLGYLSDKLVTELKKEFIDLSKSLTDLITEQFAQVKQVYLKDAQELARLTSTTKEELQKFDSIINTLTELVATLEKRLGKQDGDNTLSDNDKNIILSYISDKLAKKIKAKDLAKAFAIKLGVNEDLVIGLLREKKLIRRGGYVIPTEA